MQAGPRWVAIGPVPTLLSRKLEPSVVGGSSGQNHRRPTTIWNLIVFVYETIYFTIKKIKIYQDSNERFEYKIKFKFNNIYIYIFI